MGLLDNRSQKFWGFSAIIGANLIWGVNYVVSKMVVNVHIDPITLTMYRILVAAALMWGAGLFYKHEKVDRKDLVRMFFAALFGVTLNQSLFIGGIAYTTPIDAAIIVTLNPILVLVLSAMFLGDKITLPKVVGIVLGASGAISLVTYSGAASFGAEHLLGNLMILGNATSYALYLVTIKPIMAKYSSLTVIKWVFLFGTIQFIPVGIVPMLEYDLLAQTTSTLLEIGFIVVGATFLAYLLTSYALSHIKATTVSIFAYSQPAIAAIFSLALGVDTLSWVKLLSMGLVCIGVYLASKPSIKLPLELFSKKL